MNLGQELRNQVIAYLAKRMPLDDLYRWLAAHVQAIADSSDAQARRLADDAWILIAELDRGHRDEDSVRQALSDLIEPSFKFAPCNVVASGYAVAVVQELVLPQFTPAASRDQLSVSVHEELATASS